MLEYKDFSVVFFSSPPPTPKESRRFRAHSSRVVQVLLSASKQCGDSRAIEGRVRGLVDMHRQRGVIAGHIRVSAVGQFSPFEGKFSMLPSVCDNRLIGLSLTSLFHPPPLSLSADASEFSSCILHSGSGLQPYSQHAICMESFLTPDVWQPGSAATIRGATR